MFIWTVLVTHGIPRALIYARHNVFTIVSYQPVYKRLEHVLVLVKNQQEIIHGKTQQL